MSLTIKLRITPSISHFNPISKTHKKNLIFTPTTPIYHYNKLTSTFSLRYRTKTMSSHVIKSSLIEPDGGVLVDLIVSENEKELKCLESEKMVKVGLTKIDLEWVHVISEGWASPLKGFMREDEYLQSLHFNSLRIKNENGNGNIVNMSLPIVLAIDNETKERIGDANDVALVGPDNTTVAILRRFAFSEQSHFRKIYM